MLLPKIKINRNFLTLMISVSTLLDRLKLPSLEVEEAVKAIDLIILLYNSPTLAKFLLQDSIELLELESGLIKPILESDYE